MPLKITRLIIQEAMYYTFTRAGFLLLSEHWTSKYFGHIGLSMDSELVLIFIMTIKNCLR